MSPNQNDDAGRSCLVEKLGYYVTLSKDEEDHLARLEKQEQDAERGAQIRRGGEAADHLFVVKTGWLFGYTVLEDGRRQVLQLHFPGDIVGLPDLAFKHATTGLQSATEVVLCPFPKSGLDDVLTKSPTLTALLMSIGMVDHVVLLDRIRLVGRMSAKERIAHLLLEIMCRLRITNPGMEAEFRMPLTQDVIGDAVGLTNVYVSRTLGELEQEGFIQRSEGRVQIARENELRKLTDFEDRYFQMDTSWFPDGVKPV